KREEMKQIMRWAGPRMLWRHPILTVRWKTISPNW
ncbi:nitrous oxide-stimulated promoter family protein, partial [Escherichia coli]